ncbi:hypothetical protein FMEAI12_2890020 [Parafrankia sp. Ea1.12]|nr:hypothetical protein FMEAI12_2890020 [Parafrankia sp. Ea1.12]
MRPRHAALRLRHAAGEMTPAAGAGKTAERRGEPRGPTAFVSGLGSAPRSVAGRPVAGRPRRGRRCP